MTLTAVPGIRVGHAQVPRGGSGCTVVLGPFRGAVEVRGFATGTRELGTLSPYHLVPEVDAVLLTGGSAFGLAAADGVMAWLSERGRGFDTGVARVPLVPAAVIFDLATGVARPGPGEGRVACENASRDPVPEGRVGAGSGATVGKALGAEHGLPGGVGSASRRWREGTVGALAVVNALGYVVGRDGTVFGSSGGAEGPRRGTRTVGPGQNTTMVVVATDHPLGSVDLGRLAGMACGAFPRAIVPVHTPFDGDVLFALSTGQKVQNFPPEDLVELGTVAREITEEAIRRAVDPDRPEAAESSGGVP